MKLVRSIQHIEGVPEIFVFYCPRCKHAETKVLESAWQANYGIEYWSNNPKRQTRKPSIKPRTAKPVLSRERSGIPPGGSFIKA